MSDLRRTQPHPRMADFLSSRQFVEAFDAWASGHLPAYSRRAFAKWAKVRSPNFLSLLIAGKRSLQGEWLEGFCRAAKLTAHEQSLLKELCTIEHERNHERKTRLLRAYHARLQGQHQYSLALQQLSLLRNPLAWTLLQVIVLGGVDAKASSIKKVLRQNVMAAQIDEALSTLRACGLIEKVDERWVATHRHYSSPDQIRASENAVFHTLMLQEATDVLKTYDAADRSFGSLTFAVPRELESELKNEIQKFGQKIATKYSKSYPVDGNCYRLNLQLYSLTNTEKQ